MSRVEKVEKVRLGDHLDFSNGHTSGHTSPASEPGGRYPVPSMVQTGLSDIPPNTTRVAR